MDQSRTLSPALKVLATLLLGALAPPSLGQTVEYCLDDPIQNIHWTECYDTLPEAEAAIRAMPNEPSAPYLEYEKNDPWLSGGMVVRHYSIKARPPIEFGPDEYYLTGYARPEQSYCESAAGLDDNNGCAEESGAIADAQAAYPKESFILGGAYGQPVRAYSTSLSHYMGTVVFQSTRTLQSESYMIGIGKRADFRCADGLRPTVFPPLGSTPFEALWPSKACSDGLYRRIRVQPRQVASCPANANPCYPATGDKARFEKDFEFAGWSFRRNYHSLQEISGFAPGWTYTFSEKLIRFGSNTYTYINEDGYFEEFRFSSGGTHAYASAATRSILYRNPNNTSSNLTMYSSDGVRRTFSGSGQLLEVSVLSNPARTVYISNGPYGISTLTDITGRVVEFVYDGSRLQGVVLPDGEVIGYSYDALGNLAEVTRPDGSKRVYHYGEAALAAGRPHHLTGITAEDGERFASFGYDESGRVASSRLHLDVGYAEETLIEYPNDQSAIVRDSRGVERIMQITNTRARRVSSIESVRGLESFEYGPQERIASHTNPAGVLTQYTYQFGNTPRTITRAVGTPQEVREQYSWNSNYQLLSKSIQSNEGQGWASIRKTSFAYNANGSLKAACSHDGSDEADYFECGSGLPVPPGVRETVFEYCSASDAANPSALCPTIGQLKKIDGPRSDMLDTTTFTYHTTTDEAGCDTGGPCHRAGDLWKVTSPLGLVVEYARYDRAGRPTRVLDANGVATDLAYNARGWLVTRKVRGTDDNSEADDSITTLAYDAVGNVVQVTQPDGSTLAFEYDDAHRLVAVEDALGNRIEYTLDGAGQTVQEQIRDDSGALRHSLSRVYDALGQLETLADAQANPTDFTYDAVGNATTVTDALGRVNELEHDPLGRLVQSIANVNGSGEERATTGMEYDALDQLVAVTDPKGLTTQYTYDGLGNLVELDSPDTGVASYGYDAAGNRTSVLDARGVQRYYSYDALGRLTGVDVPTVGEDTSLVYDAAPAACLAGETFAAGRLASLINYAGTTDYCYDHRGNVVRKTQAAANGPTREVAYAYDPADRVASITYPSGAVVTYQRDATGRVIGVQVKRTPTTALETIVSSIGYQPFGPLNQITFGNGRVLSMSHDLDFAVESISDSAAGGVALDYTYDAVGNVVGIDERLNSGATASRSIGYDGLDRLTAMTDGATPVEGFSYDATGNRLSRTTTSTVNNTYATDSHRLTKMGTQSRAYDAAGNGTAIAGRKFVYDDYGRMRQFINGTTLRNEYRYNGRGERIAKLNVTSPNNSVYFVYDEAGRLLGEYKPSGVAIKEYVWLEDHRPVAVLGGYQGQRIQYVLADHLGTPRAVVNPATDAIIWRWDLTGSAFGNHTRQANPDGDGANYALNLRYPGQYYDGETGLHYNYFRDYDPATGRYVQSDPIGLGGGVNTFAYAASSPARFSDPLGLAIYLQFHAVNPPTSVRTGPGPAITIPSFYHGKLLVVPDNPAWRGHPYFENGFAYFGGGPDKFGGAQVLLLRGGINRDGDVEKGSVFCVELDLKDGVTEDEVIKRLIDGTYAFNAAEEIPYTLLPSGAGSGQHNSNSYVRGLGASAGLILPGAADIPLPAPGYTKPVSTEWFR